MSVEQRLQELGLTLPVPAKPAFAYVPFVRTGNLVFVSGQDCRIDGERLYTGKVGQEVSEEQGYEAARVAALNALGVVNSAIGSLDRVKQIVNVHGYVNSADGFNRQPFVINGASDLLLELFGERGRHSRCALGANELPFDTPVELEMVVEVEDGP